MSHSLHPDWLRSPALQTLAQAFAQADTPLYFVGGCVRDTLLKRPVGDIDATTPADPQVVMQLLEQARLRTVPTGIDHGTVTALVPPVGFEITSFRRDLETDGRHAIVAFGGTMEEDAARRDFTMNALYLSPQGELFDPTGQGLADVQARTLRFVGDAAARIAEDGLRLLRFWRFVAQLNLFAWDASAQRACAAAAPVLDKLSGERLQAEMRKLLSAPAPARAWEAMRGDGVLERLVPGAPQGEVLDAFAGLEQALGLSAQPIVRLGAVLRGREAAARQLAQRWRLSNADRDLLLMLSQQKEIPDAAGLKACMRREGFDAARRLLLFWGPVQGREWVQAQAAMLADWAVPVFPLAAADLLAAGYERNAALGQALRKLEDAWEKSGYTLSKDALLAQAEEWK